MENTQATRAATRAKLGPWYVWQARNPAAPGMSFSTLMALVKKGRITKRSVVRGPTTGQLWRYAARVKGLSREFGNCWHCGGELGKAARLCAACKRLQQPPINPDALLETSAAPQTVSYPQAGDPGYRGLLSLSPTDDKTDDKAAARDDRVGAQRWAGDVAGVEHVEHVVTANFGAENLTCASESLNTGETALPMVDITADSHPVEMRAFQLPGEELSIQPGGRQGGGLFRKLVIAALLAFVFMSVGLYFNPAFRPRYVQWFHTLMARLTGPDGRPVNHPGGNGDSSVTATHREPRRETMGEASGNATREGAGGTPQAVPPTASAGSRPDSGPQPPEITFGPGGGQPTSPPPTPIEVLPRPLRPDASIEISPPPSDPQALEGRANDLRDNAIGFERRGDWAAAVRQYELILQLHLPEGVGPTDVQARLDVARKLRGRGD